MDSKKHYFKQQAPQAKAEMPVSDVECERTVVGTLLTYPSQLNDVREILDGDCFSDKTVGKVFEALCEVEADGNPVDLISVSAKLASKPDSPGIPVLLELTHQSVVGDLSYYAFRLKELALRRRLWLLGHRLVAAGISETDDVDEVMEQAQDTVSHIYGSAETKMTDLAEVYERLRSRMDANRSAEGDVSATPTGFRQIDSRGGLTASDLVVVAGESSHGKTSLATAFMLNAARAGKDVAVYSMEMTSLQLAARIASMQTDVSALDINRTALTDEQYGRVDSGMRSIDMKRLHFDDRATSSLDNILASIRTMKRKHDISGAVIDYLQILNVNSQRGVNKEQAMGEAARRLKNLARELDIWIVALSQLSRDRENPEPDISRLRDSGQIAEAADVVILVYRPELRLNGRYGGEFANVGTTGTAMVNVAKGRNIGTFRFICGFDAARTLFYPLASLPDRSTGELPPKAQENYFCRDMAF